MERKEKWMDMWESFVDFFTKSAPKTSAEYEQNMNKINELISNGTADSAAFEKPKLPDIPTYDRVVVEDMTEEAAKKRAEDKLKLEDIASKEKIENEISSDAERLAYEKSKANENKGTLGKSIQDVYEDAIKRSSDDSLKRGLARSSIASGRIDKLEGEKSDKLTAVEKEFTNQITAIEGEINGLSAKRQKALDSYNIGYAAKITTEINSLLESVQKKKDEALKYNNSVTEKEANASKDKIMSESDLYSEMLSQKQKENDLKGSLEGQKKAKQSEIVYNELSSFLGQLSPQQAREQLMSDKNLKDKMSEYHYYKLYDRFMR